MAARPSRAVLAVWLVTIAFVSVQRGLSLGNGSGSTTSRAALIRPSRSSATKASVSTRVPRPTLIKQAPSRTFGQKPLEPAGPERNRSPSNLSTAASERESTDAEGR
jgi:hypothetical protein